MKVLCRLIDKKGMKPKIQAHGEPQSEKENHRALYFSVVLCFFSAVLSGLKLYE
jgi:cytochrome b subunit of formate dehydrogenase